MAQLFQLLLLERCLIDVVEFSRIFMKTVRNKNYKLILFLIQENVVDQHSVGPFAATMGGKPTDRVKNILCHCMTVFPVVPFLSCFICNKLKVKFMHSRNHFEHYSK